MILETIKEISNFIKQPTTLKGITSLAGVLGIMLAPEQIVAVVTAVLSIVGAIDIFTNEDKEKEPQNDTQETTKEG